MISENPSTIKALIASVTATSEISLNKGSDDNVAVGDLVEYSRIETVVDPVTREKLGSVKYILCNFKIDWVDRRFSIARVTDVYSENTNYIMAVTTFGTSPKMKTVTTDESKRKLGVVVVNIGDPVTISKSSLVPQIPTTKPRSSTSSTVRKTATRPAIKSPPASMKKAPTRTIKVKKRSQQKPKP